MQLVPKFALGGATLLVLAVGVLLLLHSKDVPAQTRATWESDHVYQFLPLGGESSVEVTLSLDPPYADNSDLSLSVTPSLESYISVPDVPTGDTKEEIVIVFKIPEVNAYETIEGTLHLRDGRRNVAKPLPITLGINEYGIPPDPGEAGKDTLEGIDLDEDGVRDDVERWIGINASQSESAKAGLTQFALGMQKLLLAENDQGTLDAAYELDDARACLFFLRRGNGDASVILAELRAEYLNTVERSQRYLDAQSALSGNFFGVPIDEWQDKCSFDYLEMGT